MSTGIAYDHVLLVSESREGSSHSVCSVLYLSEFEKGFLNEVWTEVSLR